MLNKDEEKKLNMFVEIVETSKETREFPQLCAYDIEWLTLNLKEVNDELIEVKKKLKDAYKKLAEYPGIISAIDAQVKELESALDRQLIKETERAGIKINPLDISDRWYPRES